MNSYDVEYEEKSIYTYWTAGGYRHYSDFTFRADSGP